VQSTDFELGQLLRAGASKDAPVTEAHALKAGSKIATHKKSIGR
jgi:hypothetical protein